MLPPNGNGNGFDSHNSGTIAPVAAPPRGGALVPTGHDLTSLSGLNMLFQGGPQRPPALTSGPDAGTLLQALRRRFWPALGVGLALGGLLAALVWLFVPQNSEVTAYLKVLRREPKLIYDPTDTLANRGDINEFANFKATLSQVIVNPFVLNAALNRPGMQNLGIVREQKDVVAWLQNTVRVRIDDSELVSVSLSTGNAEEAVEMLNAVVDAYIEDMKAGKRQHRQSKYAQLREKQTENNNMISKNADKKKALLRLLGTTNPETANLHHQALMVERNNLFASISKLEESVRQCKIELGTLDYQLKTYTPPPTQEMTIETLMRQDPQLHNLESMLQASMMQLEELRFKVAESRRRDPRIIELTLRIQSVRDDIEKRRGELREQILMSTVDTSKEQLAAEIQRITDSKAMLETEIAGQREKLAQVESQFQRIGEQSTDLEMVRTEYLSLQALAKSIDDELRILDVEGSSKEDRVSIYQKAFPPRFTDAKLRMMTVGFSGFVGLALGLVGMSFLEFRNRRLNGEQDISDGLGVTVVGTVPALSGHAARRLRRKGGKGKGDSLLSGLLAESMNSLRTTLLHTAKHDGIRMLMVTSAAQHEGKTTVATQLAASIARAGRRTLLIDGDLRCPATHRVFEVPLEPGFCEALRGEMSLQDVVRPTRANGLWILPAGRCDRECLEALGRSGLRALFDELRPDFDFIVIDAAPVLGTADAMLIGQHCDAAILSVRRDVSRIPKLYEAHERMRSGGIRVLGAVVNGVNPTPHDRKRQLSVAAVA